MNHCGNPTSNVGKGYGRQRPLLVPAFACVLMLAASASGPALRAQEVDMTDSAEASVEAVVTSEPTATPATRQRRENLKAYQDAIAELESRGGAYDGQLPEQLLSLGMTMQQEGQHEGAITVFKRGVHLARINNGLYTSAQVPLLQAEINSHIALGQYAEADERQQYMYRVQMRTLDSGLTRAEAFMQQADWQHNAYRLALDEEGYGRLMNMWDLYRLALNDIVAREGDNSSTLLQPLEGMLRTQYLIAAYQPNGYGSDTFDGQKKQNRFTSYRSQSYKKGQAVVLAMHDIETAQHGSDSLEAARSMVLLGDWMMWHGQSDSAFASYERAIGELAGRDDAEQLVTELLGEPVPLPDIKGLRRLPRTLPEGSVGLQVAFAVTAEGRVVDVERLDDNELDEGDARRFLRTLRRTTFRPRFEGGEPVTTERVEKIYDIQ